MKVLSTYTSGTSTLLDDEDYLRWNQFFWGCKDGYICADFRNPGKKAMRFFLHRLIMEPEPGRHVHHKNKCRWDNRRENLEVLTYAEHLKRHPESKRLAQLVEKQRLWIEEQILIDRMKAEGIWTPNLQAAS